MRRQFILYVWVSCVIEKTHAVQASFNIVYVISELMLTREREAERYFRFRDHHRGKTNPLLDKLLYAIS